MSDPKVRLSICIATFNRAAFLGEAINSITAQAQSDYEIVISDNASTDNTEQVALQHTCRSDRVRYVRQNSNVGADRNYDKAVQAARGEYCWLMGDDDLIKPGAIARVLGALSADLSLIVVNGEFRDHSMKKVLQRRFRQLKADRMYEREEMDSLFVDLDDLAACVSSIIVKRTMWLERDREKYFDSWFIHVGVIFQERLPGRALVIAEPLFSYRMGNSHSFKLGDVWYVYWPLLVESLALSSWAKRKVRTAEPWSHPGWLLVLRGLDHYSLKEYHQWIRPRLPRARQRLVPKIIALLPGVLVNAALVAYYLVRQDRGRWLHVMRRSPLSITSWLAFRS